MQGIFPSTPTMSHEYQAGISQSRMNGLISCLRIQYSAAVAWLAISLFCASLDHSRLHRWWVCMKLQLVDAVDSVATLFGLMSVDSLIGFTMIPRWVKFGCFVSCMIQSRCQTETPSKQRINSTEKQKPGLTISCLSAAALLRCCVENILKLVR